MARQRKSQTGELLTEKIVLNVTPSLSAKLRALAGWAGRSVNEIVTAQLEEIIAANAATLERLMELEKQHAAERAALLTGAPILSSTTKKAAESAPANEHVQGGTGAGGEVSAVIERETDGDSGTGKKRGRLPKHKEPAGLDLFTASVDKAE